MSTRRVYYETLLGAIFIIAALTICLSINVAAANYLIDDTGFTSANTYDSSMIQSGWNFDNRGGTKKYSDDAPYQLNDISSEFGTRLIRYINAQSGGTMTLETAATISTGSDGFYYEFVSTNDITAYRLVTDNGHFNIIVNGVATQLTRQATQGTYTFKIILDLENKTSTTIINSVSYGTYAFAQVTSDINKFVIGTTNEDRIHVKPSYVQLYSDYAVNERFVQVSTGNIPIDWTRTITGSASAGASSNEMNLNLTGTGSSSVKKSFNAVSGNVCFETLFMLPNLADGASFKMMSESTAVCSVFTKNNKIYSQLNSVSKSWNFVVNNAVSTEWNYINMTAPTVNGNVITATGITDDPKIIIKNDINLDISDVGYLKVRVSGIVGDIIRVYYTTEADPIYSQAKSISLPITSTAMTDYYLPMYTNTSWGGTLKGIRVDPICSINTFSIESVALCNDTLLRDYYLANMWYRLRIEADTNSHNAVIKINGKTLGTVNFENTVSSIDNIQICVEGTSAATLKFDDVYVYTIPEVADYVPQPVKPAKSSDSYIGINVCSLWRNGEHWGWDNISAFDEVKPYLGYYDEGKPEVADWEIKFMVEHGIDYQSYCWYASSQSNEPIKSTQMSGAIHDGFMNAKYSDMMKFAIIFEASRTQPASSAAFRNYFVPYWVEYFFTDNRYMVIDNKPIISVYSYDMLIAAFGSEANLATELEYVRSVCRGLGFDGAIFLACTSSTATSELQKISNCGFDGVQAYCWTKGGYDPLYTQGKINAQYNQGIIHVVPTVSTGFNNVGWGGQRSPNMSVSDFASMMLWVKNTALPQNDPGSWKSKLAIIATWNEYGEGTYVMPSGLNGFGYLDGVRSAFTVNPAHADDIPTANQKSRLGHLYPQNRALIRPLQKEDWKPTGRKQSWNFVVNNAVSTDWSYVNMTTPTVNGGVITATSITDDPAIIIKNDVNLDISDVEYLIVRASGAIGDIIRVYYTTATDPDFSQAKSVSLPIISTAMTDYYLLMNTNTSWAGTLKKVRIDPICSIDTFSIESIALLYDENNVDVIIDGVKAPIWHELTNVNGHYMIPMLPDTGIFYYFNSYYEWDKETGTLYMAANNHEITFTMGSSNVIIDGVSIALDCTPYLFDGIPMLPIDVLADAFDYSITIASGTITISTLNIYENVIAIWTDSAQNINVNISNKSLTTSPAVLVAILYDSQNKLVGLNIKPIEIIAGSNENYPLQLVNRNDCSIRVFIWDNLRDMKPKSKVVSRFSMEPKNG